MMQAIEILENSPICALLADADRKIVYANPAVTVLLGYSVDECLGSQLDDFVHDASRDAVIGDHRSLAEGGERVVQEHIYRHKSGLPIPMLCASFSYRLEDDRTLFATQLMDVSAQKHAERKLAVSEERSNFALEGAGQGVWDRNLLTGEVFHSDLWFRMRGFEPGDLQKTETWQERLHPADREHALKVSGERKKGLFTEDLFEYRERHADGHWMWVLSRGRAIEWGPDGKPIRIVGTDTDLTRIKEAEHELEKLSARLELALSTARLGVWFVDMDDGSEVWDDQMMQIYGNPDIDPQNVPRDFWKTCLHPDDFGAATKEWCKDIGHGTYKERRFRIIHSDGSVRHIASVARYYVDADGTDRLLGTDHDVTEEAEAENELIRARELAERHNIELEAARAEMERQSLHDALTGLPNRRYLDQRLAELSVDNSPAALLQIDIDRFKQINDTLGHSAGDAILVHSAEVLRDCIEPEDFLARVGGDEFVICIKGQHSEQQLEVIAKRIIDRMRRPFMYEGHECRFGVSIGIAQHIIGCIDTKRLLVNADIALYRAKYAGRSCFHFFTPELQREVVRTKRLADEILVALEREEFEPFYQLQFGANSLDIVGVEALARWRHPTRGLVTPDQFLSVAENLNTIDAIDRMVLQKALDDFADWRAAGISIPKVSVNVSSRRLRDEDLVKHLETLDFEPGTLSFELLESIFLDNEEERITWNVDSIKDMGIEVDVDDFGTGHASIVGLLKIAPNRLKIDRQLIGPIATSERERLLVKSIIEIGRSLGIGVVAEGVETPDQVAILRDLDCDVLQGFLFCKPISAQEVADFAVQQNWRKAVMA